MSKIGLLKAIDRAIAAENQASAFYREAAEKTCDPNGAAMFKELADFEHHHETNLVALKESLGLGSGWIAYAGRSLSKMPSATPAARKPSEGCADALEALRIAIEAEEKAAGEYRSLAAAAEDAEGRRMFERLAQEEAMHRKLLDEQFSALANHGAWFWND